MIHHPTLAGYVLSLPDRIQRAISAIHRDADGTWRLSIHIYQAMDAQPLVCLEDGTVRAEHAGDRLLGAPPQITMTGFKRHPDICLTTDEEDTLGALRRLRATELVGNLDVAVFRRDGEPPHYLAKTHAGSDAERLAWLRRCQD